MSSAKDALSSGGRFLEANGPDESDLARAAASLKEGLRSAASTIAAVEPSDDLEGAIAALEDGVLKATIGSRTRARDLVGAISRPGAPLRYDLERAELFLAKLIEYGEKGRSLRRAERRASVLVWLVVIAIVSSLGVAIGVYAVSSDRLAFRASSTSNGFPLTGRVGDRGDYGIFFHTDEEDHPWVEIDLNGRRKVHRVTIENRRGSTAERAVPLVVELRDAGGNYHEVARRDEIFSTWDAEFPSEEATAVRLVVPRVTFFHLSNVQIR
jgi:hypothetical protein